MIWEADEKIGGSIDYEDLQLVFQRNISDRTGLEPSKLYNLVQFLIFDSNENKMVSVDETMAFLHARYGRSGLEFKLKELFGPDMVESGTEVRGPSSWAGAAPARSRACNCRLGMGVRQSHSAPVCLEISRHAARLLLSQGGEIDFLTYLDAVNRAQLKMYENSEQGQANLAKTGKKV